MGAQFPTAYADNLGAGKWSIGPSFDYECKNDCPFAVAIAIRPTNGTVRDLRLLVEFAF